MVVRMNDDNQGKNTMGQHSLQCVQAFCVVTNQTVFKMILNNTKKMVPITLYPDSFLYDKSVDSCNHPVPGPCNEYVRGLELCLVSLCTQRNYGSQ